MGHFLLLNDRTEYLHLQNKFYFTVLLNIFYILINLIFVHHLMTSISRRSFHDQLGSPHFSKKKKKKMFILWCFFSFSPTFACFTVLKHVYYITKWFHCGTIFSYVLEENNWVNIYITLFVFLIIVFVWSVSQHFRQRQKNQLKLACTMSNWSETMETRWFKLLLFLSFMLT